MKRALSAAALFALAVVGIAGGQRSAPSVVVEIGAGVAPVSIEPVEVRGDDAVLRASTPSHPGLLRLRLLELGPWRERELGDLSWRSTAGKAASEVLTLRLRNRPTSGAILRLEISATAERTVDLVPRSDGSLALAAGDACGAPPPDVSGRQIVARMRDLDLDVPAELRPAWAVVSRLPERELPGVFAAAATMARCRSDAPAPRDPYAIKAPEVRAWLLDVVLGPDAGPELRVLRPFVEAVPAEAARWGWLRAVELKRGLPLALDR